MTTDIFELIDDLDLDAVAEGDKLADPSDWHFHAIYEPDGTYIGNPTEMSAVELHGKVSQLYARVPELAQQAEVDLDGERYWISTTYLGWNLSGPNFSSILYPDRPKIGLPPTIWETMVNDRIVMRYCTQRAAETAHKRIMSLFWACGGELL